MLGVCLMLFLPQEAPPAPPTQGAERIEASWIESLHGTVAARFRGRRTDEASDSDFYEFVALEWGSAERDAVTLSVSARFAEDLDGERDESGAFAFDSLDDTYRRAATARLYTAHVDFHRLAEGLLLRGGRQILEELPEAVPMDGGLARYRIHDRVTAAAFGGRPVNLFESSPSGDAMYGGWMHAEPWPGTRVRADYLHLKDEAAFGLFKDDLVGVALEQTLGAVLVQARYTLLESENRDATLRITAAPPESGWVFDGRVTYLFETQHALALALDPYSIFLFELEPYAQADLRLGKLLGARFSVDLAATVRELLDDAEETAFNHEFQRWSFMPRATDWPWKGVSLALSANFWQSSGDDFWTVGGDVLWKAHERVAFGAGSSFALFVVDAFTGTERDRVRSLYGTLRWKVDAATTCDARLGVDRDDAESVTTVELGVRRAF